MTVQQTTTTALDHVVLLVKDLDTAAEDFVRLGFTVTPESRHSMGSRNRCIMLADQSYIELLDITERRGGDSDFHTLMARGNGVAGLAFREAPLAQMRQRLAGTGIPTREIERFSRPIGICGRTELAEFAVCHIPLDVTKDYKLFFCHHLTPDRLWTAGATTHSNGVEALAGVQLAVSEPKDFSTLLGCVLGVHRSGQTETLPDGAGRLFGLEQREPATTDATLRLAVRDRQILVGCLQATGVDYRIAENGSLSIPAVVTQGVRLVFTPARPQEETK